MNKIFNKASLDNSVIKLSSLETPLLKVIKDILNSNLTKFDKTTCYRKHSLMTN